MRRWLVLAPLALAACQAGPEASPDSERDAGKGVSRSEPRFVTQGAPAPAPAAPATTAQATHAPASLVGEYRVAGIDGAPLNADFGIALSIDRSRISFEPKCAGFVWDYRYEAGMLSTERAAGYGPTRQADGSIAVCAVGVAPEQRQLGQAIDAATRAARTPANGIELSGGNRSVTLFSQ